MRIFIGCFFIAALSFVLGPSSQELHNRYGEPNVERFTARPGISVAVEYGSDRLACEALIEPSQSFVHQEEQGRLMSSEGVSAVLEEIAPLAMRGKEINSVYTVSGCNKADITDYENVSLMRSAHTCDPSSPDQDVRTAITFKRDICPKPKTPVTFTRP
jgi:hypothetical protein